MRSSIPRPTEWRQFTNAPISQPAAVERTARRFIANQRYHAESLINVIQVSGGPTISNNPEILAREEGRGEGPGGPVGLLDSPLGHLDGVRCRGREHARAGAADRQ